MTGQRALVVVDVQRGFEDPALGARDNPAAEENVARLIAAWRERGDPIVFVQHDWQGGPLERGTPGFELKEAVTGEPDLRIVKNVHSSFHGDVDLDAWLRERGIDAIAVCGIQTNFCCETTARIGCDLGYDVWFVLDATHTFDDTGPRWGGRAGRRHRAHDRRQPPGRVRGRRDDRGSRQLTRISFLLTNSSAP
jgi:nicotinamidase-related amidase